MYIDVNDVEMTSLAANRDVTGSSSQQAPEVYEPNSSGQLIGRTCDGHNHMVMRPSQGRTEPSGSVTGEQAPSNWPAYFYQSVTELSHEQEPRVPASVMSPADTRLQRNSSGYPADSDPEASVV